MSYLRTPRPFWAMFDDLNTYFQNHRRVLERGRITWACTVQANSVLFEPGLDNCPGEVVYVRDPSVRVDLAQLRHVAEELSRLKVAQPMEPSLVEISSYLTNEMTRAYGLPVPESISPNLPCALSTIFFDRRHLPNHMLSRKEFPVVVTDDRPFVVAVLPSRYWSERLRQAW